MYNYYSKIVLLGDDCRYSFVRRILPDDIKLQLSWERLQDNDIRFKYSSNNYIEIYDDINVIEIALNIIPVTKLIIIPTDMYKMHQKDESIDKLVIFNGFPYGKSDLINNYKYLISNFNIIESQFVLYKEERKFGATDLSSEEESIKKAQEIYNIKNINSIVYDGNSSIDEIFELKPNILTAFTQSYRNRILRVKERLEQYEDDYEFYIKSYFTSFNPLNVEENTKLNGIFSFNKVKNSKDIWKSFVKNYKDNYLIGEYGFLDTIKEFYMEIIQDISIWEDENELKDLDKYILKKYNEFFKEHKILAAPKTELEYIRLMNLKNEDNLEGIFKERLNKFVDCKLKVEIYEYIDKKMKFIISKVGDLE